jgi:hypothetical protein
MTYDEAVAIVEEFITAITIPDEDWGPTLEGKLLAAAKDDHFAAIRPACAFATIWREDVEKEGFEFPSIRMVGAVEFLIKEPVWTKRYYDDEGRLIES